VAVALVGLLSLAIAGCHPAASWVYRDGEYGVIRVPEGTARYEAEAVFLARQAYPGGVALVRVEEVPVGELKLENTLKKDSEIDGSIASPIDLVKIQGLKVQSQRSFDAQETTKKVEIRYVFRNLEHSVPSLAGVPHDHDPTAVLSMYSDPLLGKRPKDLTNLAANAANKPPVVAANPNSNTNTPVAVDGNVKQAGAAVAVTVVEAKAATPSASPTPTSAPAQVSTPPANSTSAVSTPVPSAESPLPTTPPLAPMPLPPPTAKP
jgi:hypothetical protein